MRRSGFREGGETLCGAARRLRRTLLACATLVALAPACAPADDAGAPSDDAQMASPTAREDSASAGDPYIRPSDERPDLTSGDTLPGHPSWTEVDWKVLEQTVRWARAVSVDTLPVGDRMAALGGRFVGTDYVPQTLDPPGPERLVVNFRALDCVTFVENMMALAHLVVSEDPGIPEDRDRTIRAYEDILTSIRYRNGVIDGYVSRLHYFTEWLWDNAEKGYVRVVTEGLGGVVDPEPIDFMTSHRDAYRQLAEAENLETVRRIEARLGARPRYYIPQEEVKDVASAIRTGDVIAATSTLDGLDVAHTGIALWQDGVLRLMHAPLVGEDVQISERPLADRLLAISTQDGIMVGRPLERAPRGGREPPGPPEIE